MMRECCQAAIAAFDRANAEDPNKEIFKDDTYPKELLYAQRMSEMQARYAPEASEAVRLAVRAQHIQRWKIPRDRYPVGRQGYLQWRTGLYAFHAETAGRIMREAGCDDATTTRVMNIIGKHGLKVDPEAQLVEDVAGLVFIEYYMTGFVSRHPEYDEAKWMQIIRKTWQKMSLHAREFVFSSKIHLPETLAPLILKATQ
jgi:hypothetical protein